MNFKERADRLKKLLVFIPLLLLLHNQPAMAQITSAEGRAKEPLTLKQAVENALRYLPEIRAAQGGLQAAKAGEAITRSNYYPDIHLLAEDLEGTNNQTRSSYLSLQGIPRTGQPGISSDLSNNFLGGLVVNQVLYDFGRRSSQLKGSEAGSRAAGYGLEAIRQDAVFNVKEAYFAYLAVQRIITADQALITKLLKGLELAEEGYTVGLRPRIDVSTAKTNLINAQTVLLGDLGQLKNAKAALDHAMGFQEPVAYQAEDILGYQETPGELADFQKRAYDDRPDLKEGLAREEQARSGIEFEQSNYLPFLVGSASINARGADFPMTTNWDAAVILDFPLNWFKVRHQVTAARARLTQESERLRGEWLKIALEVEQAFNDMRSARERIPLSLQNLQEARTRQEIAEGRYKGGVGNIIEFVDAQTFLANADAGYTRTLYDYNRSVARLERAIGGPIAK